MPIKIGEIIRQKAESKGLTQKSLGRLINRHEKTVANIYLRDTIDTGLLVSICAAIEYDFFQHYYEEEPLKALRQSELKKCQEENESITNKVDQLQQDLKKQQKYIDTQEDVITLLKERDPEYKTKKS